MKSVVQRVLIGLLYAGVALLASCRQGSPVEPAGPSESASPEFFRIPGDQALRKVLFSMDTVTVNRGGKLIVMDDDFDSVSTKRVFRMKVEILFGYEQYNSFGKWKKTRLGWSFYVR